jgi:c(7)-type cytochrome triheme protein
VVALALGAVSLPGCSPEVRYRVLSTVFDGVPPPGTPPRPRRRPRAAPDAGTLAQGPAPSPAAIPAGGPGPLPGQPGTAAPAEDAAAQVAGAAPAPASGPSPGFSSFETLKTLFPKDVMGNVDWVAAVDSELIAPRPSINPEARPSEPIQLDIRRDPGVPGFEVIFPHEAHTYWLRCENCHPEIFEMQAGANPISMAKIFAGEYCGRCHGKVAFAPQTGCPRCHVRMGAG